MNTPYRPAKKVQEQEQRQQTQKQAGGKDPVEDLVMMIPRFEPQIKMALPRHIEPSRLMRMIITEIRKTPQLALCDRASFFGALIQCARLGLEPGAGLGHIYLIPRYNKNIKGLEVQIIIGYQGMVDLVERDGRIMMDAHVVYAKDQFRYHLGLNPTIDHVPYFGPDEPGEVVAVYATATYKDGRSKFRVLSRYEIEKARAASDSGDSEYSPWGKHYSEMARKTAVRRLFKMLPKNPDDPNLLRVLQMEDALDKGESQDLVIDCPQEVKDQLTKQNVVVAEKEEKQIIEEGVVDKKN